MGFNGLDISQIADHEQLFVVEEDGTRSIGATTEALAISMLITGDEEITAKNWTDVAARLTMINRLLKPFNAAAVLRTTTTVNYDGTEEVVTRESIPLDWRDVKRHIGLKLLFPSMSGSSFGKRMLDAVKREIAEENAAEAALSKQ